MRVLAISDEVAAHLWTDNAVRYQPDLIAGCGDVPFDLLAWLAAVTEAPLVFVPGNHDPDLSGYRQTRSGLVLRAGIPVESPWPAGAINVDERIVDVAGLRVAGLGGSRRYGSGANQYTERQQTRRARRLVTRARRKRPRAPVDLMLAHAPPAGVGDRDDPAHQGFGAFRDLVSALQPRLFLHGHVIPAGESTEQQIGTTRVVNVFDHQVLDLECPTAPTGGR